MENGIDHFTKKYAGSRKVALNAAINIDDEMYLFLEAKYGTPRAQMFYYKLGCDLARTIMQIANWRFAGKTDQIKIMEFACGYGRILRHMVNCIPPQNVFVSDIYENAVKFCIDQFGVRGQVSVHNPGDLAWTERFDLIVVPSLFSHLPESTFSGWIAALHKLLTDDGILVFSVHGDHLLPPDVTMPERGIIFLLESESSTLDKSEYGTSYVNESFVREQVEKATGHAIYSRTKRGFWNHQDFYLIAKDPSADLSSFRYDYGVIGKLDSLEAGNGRSIKLMGWAKDTDPRDAGGVRIEVYLDGWKIGESTASGHRLDVAKVWNDDFIESGFDFDVPSLPLRLRRNGMLVVEAVSSRERECLHALSLGDSLPDIGREFFDVLPLQVFRNRVRALADSGGRRWTHIWKRLRGA
jgi:SAM-dependent methyltransferase